MKSINDLDRLSEDIKDQINLAVTDCISSGWYILGKNVSAFEQEFAIYIGSTDCVTVANGTEAIEIALKAVGVKNGDEVITVANAGFYSSISILACGATPVYADIDPTTYTMAPNSLRKLFTPKTRAVILTHLYGQMGDIEAIINICRETCIPLIEDCAQSHGAQLKGKMSGSFGDISTFSFYPTKNLGALGDGGAICTSNSSLALELRRLRQYGWSSKYYVDYTGGKNSRMDEIQAAVLRIKLKHLDQWNTARRTIAARYSSGLNHLSIVQKPSILGESYIAHLYVVEVVNRTGLYAHLKDKGIPCDIHYPVPDHHQKVFGGKYRCLKLEHTERACSRVITLPCFPEMKKFEVDEVIAAVNGWGN